MGKCFARWKEEIDRVTRQIIQYITEAKNKDILQTKYKTLSYPEDTRNGEHKE